MFVSVCQCVCPPNMYIHMHCCVCVRNPLLTLHLISIFFYGKCKWIHDYLYTTDAGKGIRPFTVTKEEREMLWYTL